MSQDSIVIFRNIVEALDVLPPELYKEVSQLVYAYAFDGTLPTESTKPTALALFLSFKPQIDFNVKRYESYVERGKKGGAPKGNSNARRKAKVEEAETNQLETSKNNLKQAETTCDKQEQAEEDIEQAKTSKNNLISISISESINNNSVDVVADNCAHAQEKELNRKFLEAFFDPTRQAQIEVICMQLHTDPETLRKEAEEVIAEWELTETTHDNYKEQAQHLINQLRIKYRSKLQENGRGTKKAGTAGATAKSEHSSVCGSTTKKKPLRSTI